MRYGFWDITVVFLLMTTTLLFTVPYPMSWLDNCLPSHTNKTTLSQHWQITILSDTVLFGSWVNSHTRWIWTWKWLQTLELMSTSRWYRRHRKPFSCLPKIMSTSRWYRHQGRVDVISTTHPYRWVESPIVFSRQNVTYIQKALWLVKPHVGFFGNSMVNI